ncbi:MAG: thioredoxin [Ignavibacteria bacterium]
MINVTDSSFDDKVLKSRIPVVVDFWAEWCGPCKMIAPALEAIENQLADQLVVAKLNIDENQVTTAKYGVRGIPTLMIFKNGQVASVKIGALPRMQLQAWIEENL